MKNIKAKIPIMLLGFFFGACTSYNDFEDLSSNDKKSPDAMSVIFCDNPCIDPEFPGGMGRLMKYIEENLVYPEECLEKNIQGRVILKFQIMEDGSVGEVKVFKSIHPLLDEEAMRVLKGMPDWKPGKCYDMPNVFYYNIPVIFNIEKYKNRGNN